MGVEHLLDPLFLFNPSCSSSSRSLLRGGRSRGRRKQWRAAARGRGRGGQGWGKGGLAAKKREKGRGRPLGFCGRKKRRLRCLLTLHPTAHNSFPHPRTEDQLLVNIFWDITEIEEDDGERRDERISNNSSKSERAQVSFFGVECEGERRRRVGGGGWKMKQRRREEERGRNKRGRVGRQNTENRFNRFKNRFNRFLVKLHSKSAQKTVLTA
jgi:hypothetical protein